MEIKTQLVDKRNFKELLPIILSEVTNTPTVGFDIETFDNPHEGLASYRNKKKVIFDYKRATVAGFSLFADGFDTAYYINLNHADVENRVSWEDAKQLLDAISEETLIICHNAPFEITMMGESLGYELGENVICSLQLAVTAYNPDEYDKSKWVGAQLGDISKLFKQASLLFHDWEYGSSLNPEQHELLNKIIAKESRASHSYNGFTKDLTYGYGLKQAVKSWFGVTMTSFEDCLNQGAQPPELMEAKIKYIYKFQEIQTEDPSKTSEEINELCTEEYEKVRCLEQKIKPAKDMGELSGEQVAAYGADDAYWCVQLFNRLLKFMQTNCPNAISTFMTQENPMIHVYSGLAREGLRVNRPAIIKRQDIERVNYAEGLRVLKKALQPLLPFPEEYHEGLTKYDPKWYGKAPDKHRKQITNWLNTPDSEDDLTQCYQVSSAVGNSWKGKKSPGPSIQHYMKVRTVIYDLMRMRNYVGQGKTLSDADARGNLKARIVKYKDWIDADNQEDIAKIKYTPMNHEWLDTCDAVLNAYSVLAGIEQRVKLYITPYLCLTDPDTNRMYPVLSSKLATRRMAMSYPNGMQLSKRGESTYVRGFFLPDAEDEVLIAVDWSQIELVLIGEFSGDPAFKEAYGQLPYRDLHLGAAADVLSVIWPSVNEEMLANVDIWGEHLLEPNLLVDVNGRPILKGKRKGYWRTTIGKGANFSYWYSGALSQVGQKLGWSSDQMWAASSAYRDRFGVAEDWRIKTITDAQFDGYVELPDGLRRHKWEVTHEFSKMFNKVLENFQDKGITKLGQQVLKKISARGNNQMVNAKIQGACATLAKRSILSTNKRMKVENFPGRFKLVCHDELVYSVHKDHVVEGIKIIKEEMGNHPDIIKNLKIDCTASVGLTFEPYHPDKAPIGQIEIDEAPPILDFKEGSKLDDNQIKQVVEYLYEHRK